MGTAILVKNRIHRKFIEALEESLEKPYDTPEEALGMCWIATDSMVASEPYELTWIGADHNNKPMERYEKFGQLANHYAAYHHRTDTVIDFTFRQFEPDAAYPLICSRDEWLARLADVWECPTIRFILDYSEIWADKEYFDTEDEYYDFLDSMLFFDRESMSFV